MNRSCRLPPLLLLLLLLLPWQLLLSCLLLLLLLLWACGCVGPLWLQCCQEVVQSCTQPALCCLCCQLLL
jgi:hypothetical protein